MESETTCNMKDIVPLTKNNSLLILRFAILKDKIWLLSLVFSKLKLINYLILFDTHITYTLRNNLA